MAETRTGCPLEMMLPFSIHAQDREINQRVERWTGEGELWLALAKDQLWLLHTPQVDASTSTQRHGHRYVRAPEVGSVWDVVPRRGLTIHSAPHRRFHDLDLSWPQQRRLISGQLWGPRADRDLLVGQLTGDELRPLLNGGLS